MDHSRRQLHGVVPICIAVLCLVGCAKEPATSMAVPPGGVGASGAGIGAEGSGPGGAAGSARAGVGDVVGGDGRGGAGQGAGGRGSDGNDWRSGGGAQGEADGAGGMSSGRGGAGGAAGGVAGGSGAGSAAAGVGGARGAAGGGGVGGAGGAGGTGDGQGVSGAMRPEPREFTAVLELRDIHFDFDRYDIRPDAASILNANAEWLRANPSTLILIEGHCDARGTNEYNLALGHHRAESAMNYLVAQGVQAGRITVISYGEERPLCTDDTEPCWAKNRRAHLLVKRR